MTEPKARSEHVRRNVAAAIEAVLGARGHVPRLRQIFEHSRVPMLMADTRHRFVEVNDPARLWLRLSRQEMRTFATGDLTPAHPDAAIEQPWSGLLDAGLTPGRDHVRDGDSSGLDLVYCGVAHIPPGLHLIAFAPADRSAPELDAITDHRPDASAPLTPRQIEVLALAADGLNGPDIARKLLISRATVRSHLANIYEKLGVGNRGAAVAKAIRLGVIQ
jgi:DNA-binding CsgD family transcriptional regulator